ncbi:MAG TPA: dephospho-CoA kinase [Woeseiaceae bacterium]|nr:dephospho-CoA kinase [Woeseiaceae bacterium]
MGVFRVGLTGGIASGKSVVAERFAERGVPVIDTDVIARELVEPGQPALEEIAREFGPGIIGPDGRLDRRKLRNVVFRDDNRRKALEGILHPRIRQVTEERSRAAGGPYQLIVVPLLVESPLKDSMDRILVVDASEATQVERLRRRDAESEEQARRMIAAQATREERLAIADDVIDNDGSLEETERQVERLHRKYLALASQA